MTTTEFIDKLRQTPEEIIFEETINVIDTYYSFTPSSFTNGEINNEVGQNSGSCKLFSFAKLQNLTQEETLYCFGEHYKNVLQDPNGSSHQNIRNFMKTGWEKLSFKEQALTEKV
ncbi:HopJ type III effector protein [Aquimarina litoralis]|uniref:HopJ type III effector protein n=1 Tax=Aquimarina litoralis TaxID=584605 RepID=UPI001C559F94|nr:HopJ type III effector protein [Aquimarina litoralis]MBW1298955.1 type III effector [Aquimarina litoralis]